MPIDPNLPEPTRAERLELFRQAIAVTEAGVRGGIINADPNLLRVYNQAAAVLGDLAKGGPIRRVATQKALKQLRAESHESLAPALGVEPQELVGAGE